MSWKREDASKLGAILQEIASKVTFSSKNSSYKTTPLAPPPITADDEYDGPLADELADIVGDKLTLENLQKALKRSRKIEVQGSKLYEKIADKNQRLSHIVKLHEILEENRRILEEYKNSKFLPPWLTKDKRYYEIKEVIECLEDELKQKHKIEKKSDLDEKIEKFEPKKGMMKKLKKLVKKQAYIKRLLFSAIKAVSKKFKSRILAKHPELEMWLPFLSCEQAKNLVKLKEEYQFTPNKFNDFVREIKAVKQLLGPAKNLNKARLLKKLNLLELVSNEAHQNISHEHKYNNYLLPDATREQQNRRDFGFGRDF